MEISLSHSIASMKQRHTRTCGHRRKAGCMTCKKRKLGCDEKRPICGQCLKSKRHCYRLDDDEHRSNIAMLTEGSGSTAKLMTVPLAPANQPPQLIGSKEIRDILWHLPIAMEERFKSIRVSNDVAHLNEYVFVFVGEIVAYAEHLPSRMGYDECLDAAVRAVAWLFQDLKLHQLYSRNKHLQLRGVTLGAYTLALKLLQDALYDQKRSHSAEILCATELLASFESIKRESSQAAVQHIKGISQLIQHRGSAQFISDFELSLLTAQFPALFVISLYSCVPIFLDDDEWRFILQSAVSRNQKDSSHRHNFTLDFFMAVFPLPKLLFQCIALLSNHTSESSIASSQHQELERQQLLENLISVLDRAEQTYQQIFRHDPTPKVQISGLQHAITPSKRDGNYIALSRMSFRDLMRNSIVCYQRLYVALGGPDAHATELNLQNEATSLFEEYSRPLDTVSSLRAGMIIKPFSHSILSTGHEWLEYTGHHPKRRTQLVPATMFHEWLRLTGFGSMK